MHRRTTQPGKRRRGIILLVVLAMLTLFAIAGITFVLYANSAADSARIAREAEDTPNNNSAVADMDPQAAFDLFLGQLIYGVPNDPTGVGSAIRGHSLAENMYGSYDATPNIASDRPFIGVGRLHYTGLLGQDDYYMPNYTYFSSDGSLHDPARFGTRTDPTAAPNLFTGGQNAPYTYPDLNSMFLASIRASDGMVLTPSFHRSWLFNPNNALNDQTNPNWTSPTGKYMTLRPRPQENPTFPYPTDATGDVKNLTGMPGGNDSIWMDIGAPVFTTSSGQQYKMLVAPLVLDLDNRVNLNVVGNLLGSGNAHASNQGWGPWEVNMGTVLNATANPTEWSNLFLGNPPGGMATIYGRYGQDQRPSTLFTPPTAPATHQYAQTDYNGVQDPPPNTATAHYTLPTGTATFPTFPTGYGNGAASELQNSAGQYIHPLFYNPLLAGGDDRVLPLSAHASLLWAGVAASPSSDLVRLCTTNFSSADPATTKRINETTLLSMDLDRPGAVPYYSTDPNYTISYTPSSGQYTYNNAPVSFPPLTGGQARPNVGKEFDPNTWRSTLANQANVAAAYTRLDLNRKLTDYPAPNAQGQMDLTNPMIAQAYQQATSDRQTFAQDIYNRLCLVTTGALPPNPMPSTPSTTHDSYQWLAQLAVNMVDYIDTDDIMTPFNWDQAGGGWVFGTEMPKLVVNEAYLQYNNPTSDNGSGAPNNTATQDYQMNVWVELLNPLAADTNSDGFHNSTVNLMVQGNQHSAYQVVLEKQDANIRSMSNTLGDPAAGNTIGQPVQDTDFSTPTQKSVSPIGATAYSGATAGNQGFYVIGPADTTPGMAPYPNIPDATLPTSKMTYTVMRTDPNADSPPAPTILLRRLANPYADFNNTQGPTYNPYITVDYVDLKAMSSSAVNDGRKYTMTNRAMPLNPDATTFASWGRMQPYAGVAAQWKQQNPTMPSMGQSKTTFYRHNGQSSTAPMSSDQTLTVPFNWLTQLDRPLVSPIELMQVSAFKPHELTQQFIDATGASYGQRAPWTDPNSCLYRLLEFVKVKNPTPGVFEGGRVPGKVNINTVDPSATEVFQALADAQPGNTFTANDVTTVFNALVAARTPSGTPGPNDHPFWGMAMGTYQGSDQQFPNLGIANTLLAPTSGGSATSQRLLEAGTPGQMGHPYQRNELLNKLFNNLTTRSNVFAVWLTVGFFPITNSATTPMQLGPEIGLSTSTNIRHHMFAIVDRTQLQTFSTTVSAQINPGTGLLNINAPGNVVSDPRTSQSWQIQAGSTLVYDPGVYNPNPGTANEETVVVQSSMGQLVANFNYPHAANATVISRGNPGPWKSYSSGQDGSVVPYSHIID